MFASLPVSGPFMKHRILSGESASTLGPFSNTYFTPTPRAPMYFSFHSSGMVSYVTFPVVKSIRPTLSAYPPSAMLSSIKGLGCELQLIDQAADPAHFRVLWVPP